MEDKWYSASDEKMIEKLTDDLDKISSFAKSHLEDDDLHGLGHVVRVIENCKHICKEEGEDPTLLIILGWLHDIGRLYEKDQKMNHAIISAEMSKEFLIKLEYDCSFIKVVENAILSHSFSLGIKPKSKAALILRDADRMDALGAVGIYRACAFSYKNHTGFNAILSHIDEKLLKLKDTLETEAGRKIASERHDFIEIFKEKLIQEISNL